MTSSDFVHRASGAGARRWQGHNQCFQLCAKLLLHRRLFRFSCHRLQGPPDPADRKSMSQESQQPEQGTNEEAFIWGSMIHNGLLLVFVMSSWAALHLLTCRLTFRPSFGAGLQRLHNQATISMWTFRKQF